MDFYYSPTNSYLRPGHGAPTGDIRKKKFTEHQIDIGLKRSQSSFNLDEAGSYVGGLPMARFNSEFDLESPVSKIYKLSYQYVYSIASQYIYDKEIKDRIRYIFVNKDQGHFIIYFFQHIYEVDLLYITKPRRPN